MYATRISCICTCKNSNAGHMQVLRAALSDRGCGGNYSSGNTLVPYAIAPSELKPVYQFQTVSNEPPADSFGRIFPGNVLNSSQVLFTDCWNTTDSQVWTTSLHLHGVCTAASMRAGAGAQSESVRSKVCQAVQHTHIRTGRHCLQDCPACSALIKRLQASGRGLPPGLLQHGIAVHQY